NKILDFRERQRFRSVDDLLQVGGIGPPTLDKLRRYFCVESEEDAEEDRTELVSTAKPQPAKKGSTRTTGKKGSLTQVVNINTADERELQTLSGIGPEPAADIIR